MDIVTTVMCVCSRGGIEDAGGCRRYANANNEWVKEQQTRKAGVNGHKQKNESVVDCMVAAILD